MVCQIVGRNSAQKSLDICLIVPRHKPGIEQVVDVFVRRVRITSVDIVTDKVIVRGCFEVKVLYVACLPDQPVHAIEARNVRFTAAVDIFGARRWMDAEASAGVEFIDYDCDKNTRAYWHKNYHDKDYNDCDDDYYIDGDCDCDDNYDDCDFCQHEPCKPHKPDDCKPCKPPVCWPNKPEPCHPYCKPCGKPEPCKPYCKPCRPPRRCARKCNVSVVIRVDAKVTTPRQIVIQQGTLPLKPKG